MMHHNNNGNGNGNGARAQIPLGTRKEPPVIEVEVGGETRQSSPQPGPSMSGGFRPFVPIGLESLKFYAKLYEALEPVWPQVMENLAQVTLSYQADTAGKVVLFRVSMVPMDKGALIEFTYDKLDPERIARDIGRMAG